ncbi:MAG: hypothetical protein ABS900_08280, partial [Candidatus Limivicinus sp.]
MRIKKRMNIGLRTICVILMLLAAVFIGSAVAGAEEAPADEEKDASAPQATEDLNLTQLQLGSSNYSVFVPHAYRNGEVTIEEVQA